MKLLLFAATLLLASGCSGASEPASEPPPHPEAAERVEVAEAAPFTIVMLGDSLTAGFELAPEEALPEQLEERLQSALPGIDVINAGVSGDTSAGGLARYDWSVTSAAPDLLVIALGANDYLNGIDPARTKANLAEIIERAQEDGIGILLVSVSTRSNAVDDPRGEAFARLYPELAEAYGVELYEGLLKDIRDRPEMLMSDGLHPTEEGVEIIAGPLADRIAALLPDAAAR